MAFVARCALAALVVVAPMAPKLSPAPPVSDEEPEGREWKAKDGLPDRDMVVVGVFVALDGMLVAPG